MNAVRMQFEIAADISMNSVLAEYHQYLHKRYDLFLVDPSYGGLAPSVENTTRHMERYLTENFKTTSWLGLSGYRDFTKIHVNDASIPETRGICDMNCEALREQVYAYMTAEPVSEAAGNILTLVDQFNGIEHDASSWQQMKADTDAALDGATGLAEDGTEQEVPNPGAAVSAFASTPILWQVLPGGAISTSCVSSGRLMSHRGVHTGSSLEVLNSHHYQKADALMFDQYIFEKCGSYRKVRDDTVLQYEIEYILFGEESDEKNLEKMAESILPLRLAANYLYLFTNAGKQSEAELVALALCVLLLSPEIFDAMKIAILLAWGYIESIQDLKALFAGNRVVLTKSDATWKTDVWGILTPDLATGTDGSGSGFSYEDYLRVFLYLENGDSKNYRLLDLMELNTKKATGCEGFKIDYCFDSFAAEIGIASSFGYDYRLRRAVTYN